MSDEGKNNYYEGLKIWYKSDEYNSIWIPSIICNINETNNNHNIIEIKYDIDDINEFNKNIITKNNPNNKSNNNLTNLINNSNNNNGNTNDINFSLNERITIKTSKLNDKNDEYSNIKPRYTLFDENVNNIDLPTLPIVNEPEVLERIKICHFKNLRYLSIGPIIIFLHRFETIPSCFNPNVYKNYFLVDDIRRDILNPPTPHIAQLINQIHLKVSQASHSNSIRSTQAIIMLGESGSGKSKCAKDICSHLAYLASTTIRKNTQTGYIPDIKLFDNIHCILDSFGHAQTNRNAYSSRYSKAIKVSYDDDTGLIKGITYRCFHLEAHRVTSQLNGESNYRVFYEVFDDIYFAAQAMSKYGIDNLTMFRYTSKRPKTIIQPGKSSYKELSSALEFIAGVPKAKQNTSVFALLAAILHLGELEFDVIDNYGDISTVLSSDPVSVDRQNRVMNLLGINIETLYSVITKRNLNFAGNIVEKNLDLNESLAARDSLACQLYSSLFRWIVAKINEGITAKFPNNSSSNSNSHPSSAAAQAALSSNSYQDTNLVNDEFTPNIPQNIFYLYDLTGFESIERNGLEQLCINYANERIYQFLNQIIYILDKELFFSENILNISTLPIPSNADNSLTIRLLDNRSNGIFTICDDQLKLKSSTSDEKLANILYTQHSNNKNFIFSKNEQKNCEFMVKHYGAQVKYNVNGFTYSNKLESSSEILDCLKSSTLPFIKEEILSFCDFKHLSTLSANTGLAPTTDISALKQSPSSRNLMDTRSPSSRNLFENRSPSSRNLMDNRSPSSRNLYGGPTIARTSSDSNDPRRDNFMKQRSFAHSHSNEFNSSMGVAAPGRGLLRGASVAVRSSNNNVANNMPPQIQRNSNKVATLTSSCSLMMTEIISEAKLCDVTFFMCLKLNDVNDPLKFDQLTILRQLKPYNIVDILSYYHHSFPYRLDHVSFINKFSILSLIYKKNVKMSHNFMIAVWECRSHGLENIQEWKQLCEELKDLLPLLPEFNNLINSLTNSIALSDQEQIDTIKNGIKIGEVNVYMTSLSFSYLHSLKQNAIELFKQKIWNFYINKKSQVRQKAESVIGTLMLKFLEKSKLQKEKKRTIAIIAIQARVRLFLVKSRIKKLKIYNREDNKDNKDDFHPDNIGLDDEINRLEKELINHNEIEFDDVSHNQLTNDIVIGKTENESIDSSYKNIGINITIETNNNHNNNNNNNQNNNNIYNDIEDEDDDDDAKPITNIDTIDFEEEEEEEASLEPIQVQTETPISPPIGQNLLHHFVADSNNNNNDNNDNLSNKSPKDTTSRSLRYSYSGSQTPTSIPPSLSLAQQSKINELQSKVDSLEAENSRLKRKLESLSAFVVEEEKSPEISSSSPNVTNSNRKKFTSRVSSIGSVTNESVYGGDFSRPHELYSPYNEIRPDYEKYIQKTLETLDEDITYLLHGTPFYKFGRSGSVHKTLIHISPDYRYLYWKPKNPLVKTYDECRVDLRLVWRLVPGQSTPPFQAYKGISHGPMPPQRSFSLIYGFRSLDLCALDDETYDSWFIGLKYLLQLINGELQEAGLDRQLLRKKWNYIDRQNHGFLSRKEIIQLVSNLGIQFDRSTFTAALLKSTIGNSTHDEITFSQFDSLVYQLRRRPDLEILWSKIISGYDFSKDITPLQLDNGPFDASILQEVIGVNTFKEFWKSSQNRLLSDDEAKKMMAEGMGEIHQEDFPVLSYNGFVTIMTHYKNDAYDPISCVHSVKSMSYPLQHYYISSSDGAPMDIPNQEYYNSILIDDNRTNCYVNALKNGCRALELRCFEEAINPQGEQTDIYVGNPRSKERISFKETMLNIQRVAFTYSHFPLILLLEISCSIPQQKRAAKLLLKLFGNSIFTPSETRTKFLPSPIELKNRVLIFLIHRKRDIHTAYRVSRDVERMNTAATVSSTKSFRGNGNVNGNHNHNNSNGNILGNESFISMKSSQSFDSENKRYAATNILQQVSDSFDYIENQVNDYDSESDNGLDLPITSISPKNRSHSKVPRNDYLILDQEALGKNGTLDKSQIDLIQKCDVIHSSLMSLCHYSRGFRIGSHPLRDMLARIADDQEAEESLRLFNSKRLCYIYMDQNTKRFGSYGGIVNAWDCGVSLVSLCHEYPSLGTKINSGRFRQNGNCGYVLKPERYRLLNSNVTESEPLILTLHIISGKDLPIPKIPEIIDQQELFSGQKSNPVTPVTGYNNSSQKKSYSRTYSDQDNKSVDSRFNQNNMNGFHDLNSIQEKPERIRNKGFSVVVDLNGATCDDIQNKTRYIKRHGRSPYWNEVFTFSVKDISQGQLTLRVFYNEVCSSFVSIPLGNLRTGYRSVSLYEESEENNFSPTKLALGSLFIRVRFDEVAQYSTLQKLPENLKLMDDSKRIHPKEVMTSLSTPKTTNDKHLRRKTTTDTEPRNTRSHSEGRGGKRDKANSEITKRNQSRTSSRGIISYDSTPIMATSQSKDNINIDNKDQPKSRSRRDTKSRRKSESYEVSEEMTNHYKSDEIESKFHYHEVIESNNNNNNNNNVNVGSNEQNNTNIQHNSLSRFQVPPPPHPPPRKSASPQPLQLQQLQHQKKSPSPPPPPPQKQQQQEQEQQFDEQSQPPNDERQSEEYLPSYNSAVNLKELRENVRSIKKFDIDSGDESTPQKSNGNDDIEPWTPPV